MKYFLSRLIPIFLSIIFLIPPTELALASDAEVTLIAQYGQDVEVAADLSSGSEIGTLDPALASDGVSIVPIQNLFLSLTDIDPVTNEIRPEMATNWTVSEDGLVWTFHLRDDVMWMDYDPATGNASVVRRVVADDSVYGIKRACDPRLGGYYGTVIATVIAGCDVVNRTHYEDVTDTLVFGDTTQVIAVDDTKLEVHLHISAGYFLSMTTMWVMAGVPQDVIAEIGEDWAKPDHIVTNGTYFLEENVRGVRRTFVRNMALPADLVEPIGNIEHITYTVIEDGGTAFAVYQDNLLDAVGVPARDFEAVMQDPSYQDEVYLYSDVVVFYFGFTNARPPFDNVHVRRAFSAIIDRQVFVDRVQHTRGLPMIHFTPPGIIHAPPIDEIGVGFDPDYAREQMALAGFPNCEGFPRVEMVTYSNSGPWLEFWVDGAVEHLGCDATLFNLEVHDFTTFERTPYPFDPEAGVQNYPNAFTLGWGADYPDANNWVNDVLHCEADNLFMRPCSRVDALIEEAGCENDPIGRTELYRQIEDMFFGPQGEFPIAPLFVRGAYLLHKPWYTGPFEIDGLYGGAHWESYSIDMAAKLAAREN